MVSSFWQKGFYFNGSLFFFHSTQLFSLKSLYSIGSFFISLLLLRFDWFTVRNFLTDRSSLVETKIQSSLELRQLKKNHSGHRTSATLLPEILLKKEHLLLDSSKLKSLLFPTPVNHSHLFQNLNLFSGGYCTNFLLTQQPYASLVSLNLLKYQALTYTLNSFLVITYPVLLNIRFQQKFNIFFFYMIRSVRGISLKLGKPISRKTRARTYLSMYWTKPKKSYQLNNTTRRWF